MLPLEIVGRDRGNGALDLTNEALKQPKLETYERQAILVAIRYLRLIEKHELKRAS